MQREPWIFKPSAHTALQPPVSRLFGNLVMSTEPTEIAVAIGTTVLFGEFVKLQGRHYSDVYPEPEQAMEWGRKVVTKILRAASTA